MARILLVFPTSLYRNFTPPLNLAYIAAVLENAGNEVHIRDLSAQHPPCNEQQLIDFTRDLNPLWIGLTLNVIFIQPAYDLIRRLRSLNIKIIVGGPHPSLSGEEALLHGADIVVRGEGETTVCALSECLESQGDLSQIPGISYLDDGGQIRHNPARSLIDDLDSLPFPAKHLFPKQWYTQDTSYYQAYGPIFSGRGCPASCTYCYKGVFGHGCRLRSAENVFQEMLFLHSKFGVNAFEFMDDAFSANLDRIHHLCDLILSTPGFRPVWQCTTRLDLTTPELLHKMKRAGCFRIFYGVESGDLDTLHRVNKHLDLDRAVDVLRWTHEAGIKSIVGFMWGFPWDSPASVNDSFRLLKKIAPFTDEFNPLGILIPVPGTRLYEEYKSKYHLDEWWLSERFGRLYRTNAYFPYFQRRFYNDFGLLDDGFFPFPPGVRHMIRKGTAFIGRHNIFRNNPLQRAIFIYFSVLLSEWLFKIHPKIEQWLYHASREMVMHGRQKNALNDDTSVS